MKQITEYCKENLINEYLSTKVKLKNIFPDFPSKTEFVEFLKNNGFTELEKEEYKDIDKFIEEKALKSKTPVFYVNNILDNDEHTYWIRLCDCGRVNESYNPLLFCYLTDEFTNISDFKEHLIETISANFIGYNITAGSDIKTWTEFEKIFKKYFK